ncbi:MAG: hypothetical protein DRQ98_02715 [Gammaproteobacteria bacterium]|nr:MAG: hypothetical protein DRQ98_02715 [Gammaproteobacteria bacterium]
MYLLVLFLLALLPRLYSAQTLGWGWDSPESFTLVNFDEAGSCRAALGGFDYSTFIGRQTIAIANVLGQGPDSGIAGNPRAVKAFCHNANHILIARTYSAVTGALTVVLVAVIALLLVPLQPGIAWTAGALLALSGFHISESHSGTVDAPSVFFIYLFLVVMAFAVSRGSRWGLRCSPLFLVAAIWTKYWVFAVFAYVAYIPLWVWRYVTSGMGRWRITVIALATMVLFAMLTNSAFQEAQLYPLLAAYYLVIPWRQMQRPMVLVWLLVPVLAYGVCQIDIIASYTTGGTSGSFGTSYGAIGWNKWLRNLVNVPALLLVGLGLPACLFIPAGIRVIARGEGNVRAWLCLTPLLVFVLFMALLAPVTYYRHYLALLPVAAIVAAFGLYATPWASRCWFMVLFFMWPALLAIDLVQDYHRGDPRVELRQWYAQNQGARVFTSFYVNPPAGNSQIFRPEYAFGDAATLRQAHYLILSENWYDTAFANELNGPVVSDPSRLIKTKPEYVQFYRAALAGRHPNLVLEKSIDVKNFMPELLMHHWLYGTFQLFVGDIRVFRIVN